MSTLGLFIVVFGLLIIVTRAPLIFAPERTRAFALKMFETPVRLRALGAFLTLLGALAAWVGTTEVTPAANFVNTLGIMVIIFGAGIIIPFASPVAKVFRDVFERFSTSFLRGAGVLAVLLGTWIVWYGAGL